MGWRVCDVASATRWPIMGLKDPKETVQKAASRRGAGRSSQSGLGRAYIRRAAGQSIFSCSLEVGDLAAWQEEERWHLGQSSAAWDQGESTSPWLAAQTDTLRP